MKKHLSLILVFLTSIITYGANGTFTEYFDMEVFGQSLFSGFPSNIKQTGFRIPDDYILGIDDELIINIWGAVEEEHRKTIEYDGALFIPGIGKIHLDGKNLKEAKIIIEKKISDRYKNISVSITTGKLRTFEIFVLGEVKRPGNYTISPLTNILEALSLAGGPTEKGSLRKIKITKRINADTSIYDLYPLFLYGQPPPDIRFSRGDIIFIPLAEHLAGIRGAVRRPGIYELVGEVTINELVDIAGGALPNADFSRLQIERVDEEKNRILIDIDYNIQKDFSIKSYDIVHLSALSEQLFYKLSIEGAVRRPGSYAWTEGMRVSDVLKEKEFLPYSLRDKAEIIRTEEDGGKRVIIIAPEKIFTGDVDADILLTPQDKIIVYSQERKEKKVSLQGQVFYPGEYVIVRGDRLSDLIKRAGGFTRYAYLSGIVFMRETIRVEKEKQLAAFIKEKEEVLKKEERVIEKESEKQLLEQGKILMEQLKNVEIKGRIPLFIRDTEEFINTEYDLFLEDGDSIYIPERFISVAVIGEVNLPANILFHKEYALSHYIQKSGGYTKNADRKNIFLAKVNGTATTDFNNIEPGDTIVVPFEIKERRFALIRDIVQMFYHVSLGIAAY